MAPNKILVYSSSVEPNLARFQGLEAAHYLCAHARRLDLPLDEVRQTFTLTPAHTAYVLATAPAERPTTGALVCWESICD